jgi:hypothetical protein
VGVCICGFFNVWVCIWVGFVMCGCFVNMCTCVYCVLCQVCVCVCVGFVLCVCVCVGFVMCGCVYVWVL